MPDARPSKGRSETRDSSPVRDVLFLSSMAKGLHVLEVLAAAGTPLSWKQLVEASKLEQSAVQRILHTLYELGYLRRDAATRAYSLSGKVLTFSHALLSGDSLRLKALPYLEALNRKVGETVNLMELEGSEIVYVARYPGVHPVSVDLHVGSRLPAFCSAAGRAILSRYDETSSRTVLEKALLTQFTKYTQTSMDAVLATVARARKLGYALNDQEAFVNDISVAVPLLNRKSEVVGAVNVAVQASRWSAQDVVRRLVPELLQTAHNINKASTSVRGELPPRSRHL